MTKLEILDETVEYYKKNPRSRQVYLDVDGSMCAVGRCVINPEDFQNRSNRAGLYGIVSLRTNGLFSDKDLKEEYRGHDVEFWSAIQNLHDFERYWTEEGLSELGKEIVENLKREIRSVYSETLEKSEV